MFVLAFSVDIFEIQKLVCDLYIGEIKNAKNEEDKEKCIDLMLNNNENGQSSISIILDEYFKKVKGKDNGEDLKYYLNILKEVDYNLAPLAYNENALKYFQEILKTKAFSEKFRKANLNDLIVNSVAEGRIDILTFLKEKNLLNLQKDKNYDVVYINGIHEAILHLILENYDNSPEILNIFADQLKSSEAFLTLESLSKITNINEDFLKSLIEIDMQRKDERFIKVDGVGKFLENIKENHLKVSMLEHLFSENRYTKEFVENIENIAKIAQQELINFYQKKDSDQSFIHYLMSYDHEFNVISSDYWNELLSNSHVVLEDKLAIVSHLSHKESAISLDQESMKKLIQSVKEEKDLEVLFQDLLDLNYTDAFNSFGEKELLNLWRSDSRAPVAFLKLIATTDLKSLEKFANIQGIDKKLNSNIKDLGPLFKLTDDDLIARFDILADRLGKDSEFISKILNSAITHDKQILMNLAIDKGLIAKEQLLQNYIKSYKSGGKEICRTRLKDFIEYEGKNPHDEYGNNIMHLAIMNDDYQTIKEIQNLGLVDLFREKNQNGITPLEYLIIHPPKNINYEELSEFIIQHNTAQDINLYTLAYHSNNKELLTSLLSKGDVEKDVISSLIKESIAQKDSDFLLNLIKNYPDQYRAIQAENDYKSMVIAILKDDEKIAKEILQDKNTRLDLQYTQQPLDILKFCLYENNTQLATELLNNKNYTLKNPPAPELIFNLIEIKSDSRDKILSDLLASNKIDPNISITKSTNEPGDKKTNIEMYMLGDLCLKGDIHLVKALLKNPEINPNIGAKLDNEDRAVHPIELIQDSILSLQMDYINSNNEDERKKMEDKIANWHNIIAEVATNEKSNISEIKIGGLSTAKFIYFSPYVTQENKAKLFEQQLKNDKEGFFLEDGKNNSLLESLIMEGELELVENIVLPRIEQLEYIHQTALVNSLIRWNKEAITNQNSEEKVIQILDQIQNKTGKPLQEFIEPASKNKMIHYAAASGSEKIFDYVSKLCEVDKNDISILAAAYRGSNSSIIKKLEQDIKNPNMVFDYRDEAGHNILHYLACVDESMENDAYTIAKDVLTHKIDIDAKNSMGCTPLMLAAGSKNNKILDLILERNINIDSRDNEGNTALSVAVNSNNFHAVKNIMSNGGQINIENKRNIQPLALCMEVNNSGKLIGIKQEAARALIQNNADVSFQSAKKGFVTNLISSISALAAYFAISKIISTISSLTVGLLFSRNVHGIINGSVDFAFSEKASEKVSDLTTEFIKDKLLTNNEHKIDVQNLFLIGAFNRDGLLGRVHFGDDLKSKMEKTSVYKGLDNSQAESAVFSLSKLTDSYIEKNKYHILQSAATQGMNIKNEMKKFSLLNVGKSDLKSMLDDLKSAYSMVLEKETRNMHAYLNQSSLNKIIKTHSPQDIAIALSHASNENRENFETLMKGISKCEILVKDFNVLLKASEINEEIKQSKKITPEHKMSEKHKEILSLISTALESDKADLSALIDNSKNHATKLKLEYEDNIKDSTWKNFEIKKNPNKALLTNVANKVGALVGFGAQTTYLAYACYSSENSAQQATIGSLYLGSVLYSMYGQAKDMASWSYQFCKPYVAGLKDIIYSEDDKTKFTAEFKFSSTVNDISKYTIPETALIKLDDSKISINLDKAKGKYQSIIDNSKAKHNMAHIL
ncbi:Ankyrin repeats containing protein [Candidatus Cyrtobacter comes]|uniref:Ankyrin repeats containing protein n=1 Tax=Candidatus Cyrtobacter comes TaxID=675776 RepID=A0ABU5L6C9_9RICK|nr:ankyrin repeat domain-containing protein [Candidatus Cyrtobacter comes]MDZ5761689.1 Ankyrin repeats containing protein [Candidatus Cyrtobacter comes]